MVDNPNIVLFLTDDHAKWASGAYRDPYALTPNLDFMAREGILMGNACTPTPVCSPGRACFFTGRYASQHGVHDYLGNTASREVNKNWLISEKTLPELLGEKGYETVLIGKWHLGQEHIVKDQFDYSFTLGTEYPILHGEKRTFFRGEEPVECEGSLTRTITNEAVQYLKNRDRSKPVFLVIGHYATHSQWRGHPERLVEYYRRMGIQSRDTAPNYPFGSQRNESLDSTRNKPVEALCQYYAAVTQIDESVGAVIDEVEGQGMRDNTLIVYTSDHGLNCGDHGLWGKGNATYPLNMLDASIQIPMIFYGPGLLFGRQRRMEAVDHTDLFQTILELSGVEENETEKEVRNSPGRSFAPLLTNSGIIENWKSDQFGEYGPVRMIRTEEFKLVLYPRKENNLFFNLKDDPDELHNLYDHRDYSEIRDELSRRIEEHFSIFTTMEFDGVKMLDQLPEYNGLPAWQE